MSRELPAAPGELEFAVLDCLWTSGPLNTREVFDIVGPPRSLAYTTVLTVLQRLHHKAWVSRTGSRRSHIYTATRGREEYAADRAATLAESFARLGAVGVPAFLSHTERLDPALVETLRRSLGESR